MTIVPLSIRPATFPAALGAILCLIGPAMQAAEDRIDEQGSLVLNDVRFGFTYLPVATEIDVHTDGVATYRKDGYFDSAGRLSLVWITPVSELDDDGGFIVGMELSRSHYEQQASTTSIEVDLVDYAFTGHLGLGWVLANHYHLEIVPFAGLGVASFASAESGYGSYSEWGGRVGVFYTFTSGFQLGANLGYIETRSEQTATVDGVRTETEVETNGGMVTVQVGYRF